MEVRGGALESWAVDARGERCPSDARAPGGQRPGVVPQAVHRAEPRRLLRMLVLEHPFFVDGFDVRGVLVARPGSLF